MSLKRQTLWSMLPLLSVTVVNLVSVPLFYRYLGAEKYALWFYVLTFGGMFGFADLGLGVAVGRYIGVALGKGDREAVRGYWATGNAVAIPLLVAMGCAFTLIGAFLGPKWFNVAPENVGLLQACFAVGGLSLFLSYYGQFWLILSQAHLDFRFIGILRTAISLLQVIPAIGIAWWTGNPLLLVAWAAFTGLLQLAVFIWHAKSAYRLGLSWREASKSRMQEMAGFTGKTMAMLVINSFIGSVDRLLLGKLGAPPDFAHYNIAANVGARLTSLSAAIMGPVFHNTNRAVGSSTSDRAANVFDESFRLVFGWYLLAAVWVWVWSRPALALWLGPETASQVEPAFAPLITAYCLTSISNIASAQLSSLNRVGILIAFNVSAAVAAGIGVVVGWHYWGLQGVAFGYLASRLVLVAQDLFVMRLIGAGGWLAPETWMKVLGQVAVASVFALAGGMVGDRPALLLLFAGVHAALVGGFIMAEQLRGKKPSYRAGGT
jgi:O-antigen/teichoic acid export membrane protein